MTLHQLELLVSIADRGSVSSTADFFGLTQPTVTHQIQLLEKELGVNLVQRKSRGMDLTEAGRLVISDALPIIQMVRAIPVRIQQLNKVVEGSVTLGLSPVSPVSTYHFPPIYHEFHRRYPKVQVSVVEEGSRELVSLLHNNEVDLAIMSLPVLGSRVDIAPLWREDLVIIGNSQPSNKVSCRLQDFKNHPWILFRSGFGLTRTVKALCQSAGFDPKPAAEASTLGAVIGFVASGLGVSIVPREAALEHQQAGRVHIIPVEPP
ncbi:MAG: LysR family transcriptional regulator [Firmicutes bacterium]|nr:LysR family transcriptional regulator [Bacillota bacterium]